MTFDVRFSADAEDDLIRLFDFLLDSARTVGDIEQAQAAVDAVRKVTLNQLATTPYSFRKAGKSQTRRELLIPFGSAGYVALDEIASPTRVVVLAVRHQREQDYQ